MGATGQDAPPANGTQPEGATQPQENADPWTSTLDGVDEVYRPHVEQAINPLREQFTPRLELADRLEPLGDYADDLLALAQDGDESGNALGDVLGFVALTAALGDPENPDPQALEEFEGWWTQIGETYGLFEDDGEGGEGEDDEPDDPANARIEELEGQLQALRQELGGVANQTRADREAERLTGQLEKGLKDNGVEDSEETRQFIWRLAAPYAADDDPVGKALADYLKLTGQAQQGLLNGQDVERIPAGQSPTGGAPHTEPDEITTGDPAVSRKRAHRAAMSRLTAG